MRLPFKHRDPGIFLHVEAQDFPGRLIVRKWVITDSYKGKSACYGGNAQTPTRLLHMCAHAHTQRFPVAHPKHVILIPSNFRKYHPASICSIGTFSGVGDQFPWVISQLEEPGDHR